MARLPALGWIKAFLSADSYYRERHKKYQKLTKWFVYLALVTLQLRKCLKIQNSFSLSKGRHRGARCAITLKSSAKKKIYAIFNLPPYAAFQETHLQGIYFGSEKHNNVFCETVP